MRLPTVLHTFKFSIPTTFYDHRPPQDYPATLAFKLPSPRRCDQEKSSEESQLLEPVPPVKVICTMTNQRELHGTPSQVETLGSAQSSQIYTMLPTALQSRLRPLAFVRRSISLYSLQSRRRGSLSVHRPSESENAEIIRNEMELSSLDSAEGADARGKFTRHGQILTLPSQKTSLTDGARIQSASDCTRRVTISGLA